MNIKQEQKKINLICEHNSINYNCRQCCRKNPQKKRKLPNALTVLNKETT